MIIDLITIVLAAIYGFKALKLINYDLTNRVVIYSAVFLACMIALFK